MGTRPGLMNVQLGVSGWRTGMGMPESAMVEVLMCIGRSIEGGKSGVIMWYCFGTGS